MTTNTQQDADLLDPASAPERLPYMPGLDGLRAIAVVAVLLYHADISWIPGGFLGVDVFFVISGYLITSLLVLERLRSGHTDLKRFWLRRARRLLPALFTVLIVTVAFALLFARDSLYRLNQDVVGALGYFTNWLMIFRQESYFETFGRPPLLRHLWSLAVEEQFYIFWPLAFVGGMAVFARSRKIGSAFLKFGGIVLIAVAASTALMWILFVPFDDPSRVYFGTDTRIAGILLGVALAFVWQPWRFRKRLGRVGKVVLNAIGYSALGALVAIFLTAGEFDTVLYRGGFLVTAIVTAVLIAITVHPEAAVGNTIGGAVMRWIGTRSYGIYLWHWPVFMVTRPHADVTWHPVVTFIVRFAVTLLLSEASYRWIERPIRQLGVRTWLEGILAPLRRRAPQAAFMWPAIAAVFLLGLTIGLIRGSSVGPPPQALTAAVADESPVPAVSDPGPIVATTAIPVPEPATDDPEPGGPIDPGAGADVVLIGDSVMLGAKVGLENTLDRDTYLDATVSRQMKQVPPLIERLAVIGRLGDVVVIHLGTNGPFNSGHFDATMESLQDVDRVFFVTVSVPRRYEGDVNHAIRSGVDRWPSAYLLDWHGVADGRSDYFVSDGVHLTRDGILAYAALIQQTIDE